MQQIGVVGILITIFILIGFGVKYTYKTGIEIESDFRKIRKQ